MVWSNPHLTPRDRGVVRTLWLVLGLNWLVAFAKIVVGILSSNITVTADGLHSLLDGANNVLGIGALHLASSPPDQDHPYGHRKFENIAAMAIGGLIVLIAWEVMDNIVRTVWTHMRGMAHDEKGTAAEPIFVITLIVSVAINYMVAMYESRRGRELGSTFLSADAHHTKADCAVTGLSLLSLFLSRFGWWVDPLLALGVMAFLLVAAWEIIRENLPAFTDRAQLDPEEVGRVVERIGGVLGTSAIRSHGSATDIHLDLSVTMDRTLTVEEAERLECLVRETLHEAFPNVTFIGIEHRAGAPAE